MKFLFNYSLTTATNRNGKNIEMLSNSQNSLANKHDVEKHSSSDKQSSHSLNKNRRRWAATAVTSLIFPIAFLLVGSQPAQAGIARAFANRYQTQINGSIRIVGNANTTCSTNANEAFFAGNCTGARSRTITDGTSTNNAQYIIFSDIDGDATTFNSSSASFAVPAGAIVKFAGLYWGADTSAGVAQNGVVPGVAAPNANLKTQVKLKVGAGAYSTINASQIDTANQGTGGGSSTVYHAYADITSTLQAQTAGTSQTYTVADIQAGRGADRYGGWSLVIVYEDPAEPWRELNVFDGFGVINGSTALSTSISGFNVPTSGPFKAEFGAFVYEGDLGIVNDQFFLNGLAVGGTTDPNNASNFWDSSVSTLTPYTRNPSYTNLFALDIDLIEVTSYIKNGDTSASLNFTTAGDVYYPGTFTFAVDAAAISGRVFDDVNYGGGSGRSYTVANSSAQASSFAETVTGSGDRVGVSGARVELYDANGNFVIATTTDAQGRYSFSQKVVIGNYFVRVVNSTVKSVRPGGSTATGLISVQTFQSDGSTGVAIGNTQQVGGKDPAKVDSGANTTNLNLNSFFAQTVVAAKVAINDAVPDMDFGYNFDTIVNTNDSGQGSLRQFITNSNTLTNLGLDQVANPSPATGTTAVDPAAGEEYSIFMIPASAINGTGGNANAAVISLASNFSITDANTHLDATTQTINIGNTNSGTVGTGGTVGVDALPLSTIPKPEVVLNFLAIPTNTNAILVSGANTALKGFASYGYRSTGGLATLLKGAIIIQSGVTDAGPATITQLLGGTMADGSDPGVPASTIGYTFQIAGAANISNNYLAYNSDAIEFDNTNGSRVNFKNNELAYNGPKDNNGSNASGIYADQMETVAGAKNIILEGNLVRNSSKPNYPNSQGQGIQISNATFITVRNNTFSDNNVFAVNASSSDSLFEKNIITGTKNTGLGYGNGIIVYASAGTGFRNRITQNSIYQNALLGINHGLDGVTPNDGLVNVNQANNGIDYPIITSSTLLSGTLTVKGYVGNNSTGSSTFANVTLEFFIADDDGNQNGEVILGDGKSKSHGEGKTYIGNCTANGAGLFNCSFNNAVTATMSNPQNITATATDSVGNTSEFSAPVSSNPNVLLVKRITAVNGVKLNVYKDETNNTALHAADDNNANWPTPLNTDPALGDTTISTFLRGAIDGGKVKPGDTIEYTIYFLNAGGSNANNVRVCDRIMDSQKFLSGSTIQLQKNSATPTLLTSVAGDDRAAFYSSSGDPAITNCNFTGTPTIDNGAIVVDVTGATGSPTWTTLPGSAGAGTTDTYGLIRFTTKVNQ